MISRNSNTEPGQPCESSSGIGVRLARPARAGNAGRCRRAARLNCGKALSSASSARQSKPLAPVVDQPACRRPRCRRPRRRPGGWSGKRVRARRVAQIGDVGVGNGKRERRGFNVHASVRRWMASRFRLEFVIISPPLAACRAIKLHAAVAPCAHTWRCRLAPAPGRPRPGGRGSQRRRRRPP